MRNTLLLLALTVPFSTGCSGLIAGAGKDLGALTTREQVREQFGTPVSSGVAEDKHFDEFRTRRKLAENERGIRQLMGTIATYGAWEVLAFPTEIALLMVRTARGQHLRFWYDTQGTVTSVEIDGVMVWLVGGKNEPPPKVDQ